MSSSELLLAPVFSSPERKYAALRSAINRALQTRTAAAFASLNTRMLTLFGFDAVVDELLAKSNKLQADIAKLQRHHAALNALSSQITEALDEFDSEVTRCTHTLQCIKLRRALMAYEVELSRVL